MDWTRGRTIGRGSTAIVSIATENGSGQVFAVKSCQLSNSESLQREQIILSTLTSPHIVAYKGCEISSENGGSVYNLFLEYASGGTVADRIREHGGAGLDDGRVRSYTRAILLGLEYLHCNGVAHCDIKSQNVLVAGDGAKIADFGCSRRVDDVSSADWAPQIMGTPLYMAPEVARGEEQLFSADVWALGCTVIEMATGRPPWDGVSDPVTALYRIGFSGDLPEIPNFFSKQAKDFVAKCFIKDPRKRWSATELLKHEFVKEPSSFSREIDDYNPETPTSVLNQAFWNSMEDGFLETTWNSRLENRSSCSSSPLERIRQLSVENTTAMINWAFDKSWVTVRSNGSEEEEEGGPATAPFNISHDHNHDMSRADKVRRASAGDTTWVSEQYDFDSPRESMKTSEIKSSVMACKCANHLICSDHIPRNKKSWFLVLQLQLFICLYVPIFTKACCFWVYKVK